MNEPYQSGHVSQMREGGRARGSLRRDIKSAVWNSFKLATMVLMLAMPVVAMYGAKSCLLLTIFVYSVWVGSAVAAAVFRGLAIRYRQSEGRDKF